MVTEFELKQMKRGFVASGVVITAVMVVAAVVSVVLGLTWAIWPLSPLVAAEIVVVVLLVRRRMSSGGRGEASPTERWVHHRADG